jgi:hypothetical protein
MMLMLRSDEPVQSEEPKQEEPYNVMICVIHKSLL